MKQDVFQVRTAHAGSLTIVDARSARAFARHAHDEFGIGLMTAGAQRSWSGRGPVEAESGNLITVNPAELHDGTPVGPARAWSMLYFTQQSVATIVADLDEGRCATRILQAPVIDDSRLSRLFCAARRAALHAAGKPAFEEHALTLFAGLFGIMPRSATDPSATHPVHRLTQLRERIDDAPSGSHPLAELAVMAGLTRYQTVRGFAGLFGLTPHAYVIQRRIDMARRLIRHGSTIADAAAMAGFADQSHLHRLFQARHGFTPGSYARAFHGHRAISFKTGLFRVR